MTCTPRIRAEHAARRGPTVVAVVLSRGCAVAPPDDYQRTGTMCSLTFTSLGVPGCLTSLDAADNSPAIESLRTILGRS